MAVEPSDLEKVATLACIHLDEAGQAKYYRDLETILHFVEQIQAVDTNGVPAMVSPITEPQPLRDDVAKTNTTREQSEALSQHINEHLYQVPKVID